MIMPTMRTLGTLCLAVLMTACSGTHGDRYRAVNDTSETIRILGCEGCGKQGREVRNGEEVHIRVTAHTLTFERQNGSRYGCVAFFNGTPVNNEQELRLSKFDLTTFAADAAQACREERFG